jgi:malonyl-CoA O-methyltransferase
MKKQGIFITGTDTGVGKTVVSALLVSSLAKAGKRAGYFKPIQTGTDLDTKTVSDLTTLSQIDIHPPVYSFPDPMAPSRAAAQVGKSIHVDPILETWRGLQPHLWVIEGAGGILVPLNQKETIRDLIFQLVVPILLVASTKLGTINHTLLTLEAIEHAGLSVRGIVLNGKEDPGLRETIQSFTSVPIVSMVPQLPKITPDVIREFGHRVFPARVLTDLEIT